MAIITASGVNINWGTDEDDYIVCEGGDITIFSFSPSDDYESYVTSDSILPSGNDTVIGGEGNDLILCGKGNDSIFGGGSHEYIIPGAGNNTIDGGEGIDFLVYKHDKRNISVTPSISGSYYVYFNGIRGDLVSNIEEIHFGSGNDKFNGNSADNVISSLNGGSDTIIGEAGNDSYSFDGNGKFNFNGGSGSDALLIDSAGQYILDLKSAKLIKDGNQLGSFKGVETFLFRMEHTSTIIKNDSLSGVNFFFTLEGDDIYYAGSGVNYFDASWYTGAEDTDTLSFNHSSRSLAIDLAVDNSTYEMISWGNTEQYFRGVERIVGSKGNDSITISVAGYSVDGDKGIDTIRGGLFSDTINGGLGRDSLSGGSGADVFIFNTVLGPKNIDTIEDFSTDDVIKLDSEIFTKLSTLSWQINNFRVGGQAIDLDDYIIYDNASGKLYYDIDASGAGAMQQFAQLTGNPTLSFNNINVI